MKFLNKIIDDLLEKSEDLSNFNLVLPGKRPVVFIKRILAEKNYSGFLPRFFTIEELLKDIGETQHIKGIALWLFAFEVYKTQHEEDFGTFLKWFPTVLKDWDDMLKFSDSDIAVLDFMFDEERIKNWSENLNPDEDNPRNKFLNFWRKQRNFLPLLKLKLQEKNYATGGMLHEMVRNKIEDFVSETETKFVFCGFNAFTPTEKKLVKELLKWDKGICYFQADDYYMKDFRQESGKFLREHKTWPEFNDSREFNWIENDFKQEKNIKIFEVSGNISQTKLLPEIFNELSNGNIEQFDFSKTAIVLLDENLLPPTLDALITINRINITMGFPLKNLEFSNAMKKLFHLQKQLHKQSSSYYYKDVLPILDELPKAENDFLIIQNFQKLLQERNIIYISKKMLENELSSLSYFNLFQKKSAKDFLKQLINYCFQLKFLDLDDIVFENISHFETSFKTLKNQLQDYNFEMDVESLEVLINQLVNTESIDFQGEPLQGLQVMGLLETRLLNFENIILLSVNEGKLPLGNSQNTYLPFDVRREFDLHTFLENDGIYAYHFYRLLQDSKNVYLLYNALSSGVNTGEKSRFITQLEIESGHKIENLVVENTIEPVNQDVMVIEKTPEVLEKLKLWKNRVSASHLSSYLYNPIDFYLSKILNTYSEDEVEEELSQRNFGNLVHYSLQYLYEKILGKVLNDKYLEDLITIVDEALNHAIVILNHEKDFYLKGMNFIHKSIASRVVTDILRYDLNLIKNGHQLEILALELKIENIKLSVSDVENINIYGFIDRVDRLDGVLRIIDYKTKKATNIFLKPKEEKIEMLLSNKTMMQPLQLSLYAFAVLSAKIFPENQLECGIWSFAETGKGVQSLEIYEETSLNLKNLEMPLKSIKNLILEILNPELTFTENIPVSFSN
ncbi:PD-(D/E)XK nuclease family protein [Halpernia frigidisoli]|uniref:PD-(D/E)XK nuclease superfamily protein n=1 Tax=Halpernia frigidisoli TaxID=1125876 RepID=A0A1I3DTD3_9FLAO|nr:PD-(D/E)XK nuclease family protein [Halpernia frigidisoli]SFH90007.1 PD-(D/E)XK nuclease superfamily protein [Halpernia frigidisoli]